MKISTHAWTKLFWRNFPQRRSTVLVCLRLFVRLQIFMHDLANERFAAGGWNAVVMWLQVYMVSIVLVFSVTNRAVFMFSFGLWHKNLGFTVDALLKFFQMSLFHPFFLSRNLFDFHEKAKAGRVALAVLVEWGQIQIRVVVQLDIEFLFGSFLLLF